MIWRAAVGAELTFVCVGADDRDGARRRIERQRVAIARALAMQPVLLLFDDITSALDPLLTGEVVRVLEELAAQGRTMILVTHEMGFARRTASKIVFMHNGRVWEHGRSQQLLENPRTPELKSFLSAILRTA